jgi:hypothetical protein
MDKSLARELKELADAEGKSFTALVEEAATRLLSDRRRRSKKQRKRVALPTFRGRGLQPGVSLDDNSSLLDVMEEQPSLRASRRS